MSEVSDDMSRKLLMYSRYCVSTVIKYREGDALDDVVVDDHRWTHRGANAGEPREF